MPHPHNKAEDKELMNEVKDLLDVAKDQIQNTVINFWSNLKTFATESGQIFKDLYDRISNFWEDPLKHIQDEIKEFKAHPEPSEASYFQTGWVLEYLAETVSDFSFDWSSLLSPGWKVEINIEPGSFSLGNVAFNFSEGGSFDGGWSETDILYYDDDGVAFYHTETVNISGTMQDSEIFLTGSGFLTFTDGSPIELINVSGSGSYDIYGDASVSWSGTHTGSASGILPIVVEASLSSLDGKSIYDFSGSVADLSEYQSELEQALGNLDNEISQTQARMDDIVVSLTEPDGVSQDSITQLVAEALSTSMELVWLHQAEDFISSSIDTISSVLDGDESTTSNGDYVLV